MHGDLYAGHILAAKNGAISGIIDWSEGQVSDPSIDFSGHLSVFGEESLKELLSEYKKLGGMVWEGMFEQTVERHAAAPLLYGLFAIATNSDTHIEAAKVQLGLV
ncbi:macrolide phosphotransferase [Larkinella arboricola]|uniref:Macrolide phosphotransferase n=1 Tax=Larkinella arboricola TaxID=643671 RepID=A0A327WMF6_LARAB|nr:macrolide phosphotransferase [Larkinella arboricola]